MNTCGHATQDSLPLYFHLGLGLWEKTPFHLYEDAKSGKQQILWQFNPISDCKKFSA